MSTHGVCQQRLGEHWQGPSSIVPRSFVFLCVCVYQKVENVIFGLVMFAEGQSGPVPKTSQWSQPNLGKYALRACACANTNTKIRGHTNKHTLTHKMHMMQTNKQTNRDPDFLCSSLFVNPTDRQKNLATHARVRNARLPTEHHHLSGVKIQVAYSSLSSFQLGNGRAHERNLNKRALSPSLIQA